MLPIRFSRRRFLAVAAFLLPFRAEAQSASPLPMYFDPARDPARDLDVAVRMAQTTARRVLVEVGGAWCKWCRFLDQFFDANQDLKRYRDANYIWLKVNWSPENKNEAFLRRYPAIARYPHFFVLDASGKLAHSQNTDELEAKDAKDTYDPAAMRAFLVKWAPKR